MYADNVNDSNVSSIVKAAGEQISSQHRDLSGNHRRKPLLATLLKTHETMPIVPAQKLLSRHRVSIVQETVFCYISISRMSRN
jgi:hypothetical protein